MSRRNKFIGGFGRLVGAVGLVSCIGILSLACTADPKPTPFSLKAPIPLGGYEVSVKRLRQAVGGILHRVGTGEKGIAVYVSWTGLNAFDRMSRHNFIESFNEHRMSILDSAGNRYKPRGTYLVDFYEAPQRNTGLFGSGSLRDWVVAFTVPRETHNFTLLIENPDPQEGQPHLASVALGR